MHVMGGGDVGGAKTHIMNMVTGLTRRNEVMLVSFRAGPFADEARERGIDVRVIERHNPFRAARGCVSWSTSFSRTSSIATVAAPT